MWIEINIRREQDENDWEGMGIKKPKNYSPKVSYSRRLIWSESIVWIEYVSESETLLQMENYPEPVYIKANYDEFAISLSSSIEEDLEL